MNALICVLVLLTCEGGSQVDVCVLDPYTSPTVMGEMPDDPAHQLYKSGYAAILAKKWDESRKSFQSLLQKYPKSKYADQASYWVAYSYVHSDSQKAAEHYRQFLSTYPDSPYFSDAVADLERLGYSKGELPPAPLLPPREYDEAVAQYEQQQKLEQQHERMERQVERMERQRERLERHGEELAVIDEEWRVLESDRSRKSHDPDLEIKVAAIQALSRNNEDTQAFETLQSYALDSTADWEIRAAAVEGMLRFKDLDQTALLQSLAARGDSELRLHAINALGRLGLRNDAKTGSLLAKLAEDPCESRDIRMASLVTLSEMEYAGLMTVLEKIVTSNADRGLRQEVLMLVERAGRSDQARTIALLKSVASNASEGRETREAAVYALAKIPNPQAFAILKTIASSDPDKKLRASALYALGKQRTESRAEVEALIKEIALRTSEDRDTRMAALCALADSKGDAPIDLYEDLALREKDEEVRQLAVHLLAKSMKDKAKAFSTLSGIYGKASDKERSLKETALFGIADLGSAQAVSFLRNVAKTDPDHELRRGAVYFLGSIGSKEARAALLEILRKK